MLRCMAAAACAAGATAHSILTTPEPRAGSTAGNENRGAVNTPGFACGRCSGDSCPLQLKGAAVATWQLGQQITIDWDIPVNHGEGPCTIKVADSMSPRLSNTSLGYDVPDFRLIDPIGGTFTCGGDALRSRTITVPPWLHAGDAVVQMVQDTDAFYWHCADVALIHPRSCADVNADGATGDVYDCSGHVNAISTNPEAVVCVADACSSAECCVDTPEAQARRTSRVKRIAPDTVTASGLPNLAAFELILQSDYHNERPHYRSADGSGWLYWNGGATRAGAAGWYIDTDEDVSDYMAYLASGSFTVPLGTVEPRWYDNSDPRVALDVILRGPRCTSPRTPAGGSRGTCDDPMQCPDGSKSSTNNACDDQSAPVAGIPFHGSSCLARCSDATIFPHQCRDGVIRAPRQCCRPGSFWDGLDGSHCVDCGAGRIDHDNDPMTACQSCYVMVENGACGVVHRVAELNAASRHIKSLEECNTAMGSLGLQAPTISSTTGPYGCYVSSGRSYWNAAGIRDFDASGTIIPICSICHDCTVERTLVVSMEQSPDDCPSDCSHDGVLAHGAECTLCSSGRNTSKLPHRCVNGTVLKADGFCEVGTEWRGSGDTPCLPCRAGMSDHDSDPLTRCENCKPGRFSGDIGSFGTCANQCPLGKNSSDGSTRAAECVSIDSCWKFHGEAAPLSMPSALANQSRLQAADGDQYWRFCAVWWDLITDIMLDQGGRGAAIHVSGGQVEVAGSTLSGNSAMLGHEREFYGGGAIFMNAGKIDLQDSAVIGNSATGLSGGAIYMTGGYVSISRSVLAANHANRGGAAVVGNGHCPGKASRRRIDHPNCGKMEISQSSIVHNSAHEHGGAIYVESGGTVVIRRSSLAENGAYDGSAIFVNLGHIDVLESSIAHNTAHGASAGAINVIGAELHRLPVASVHIRDSALTDNEVADGSASIHIVAVATDRFELYNTSFHPQVTKQYQSVSLASDVHTGCQEHPCAPGHSCSYLSYSLLCEVCPSGTISTDGILCTECPAASEENNMARTECVCKADFYRYSPEDAARIGEDQPYALPVKCYEDKYIATREGMVPAPGCKECGQCVDCSGPDAKTAPGYVRIFAASDPSTTMRRTLQENRGAQEIAVHRCRSKKGCFVQNSSLRINTSLVNSSLAGCKTCSEKTLPLNAGCMPRFTGHFCSQCEDGYELRDVQTADLQLCSAHPSAWQAFKTKGRCSSLRIGSYDCLPCAGMDATTWAIAIALLILLIALLCLLKSKRCRGKVSLRIDCQPEEGTLQAFYYAMWQPMRITITYGQVAGDLLTIMNLSDKVPHMQAIADTIKRVTGIFDIFLSQTTCLGVDIYHKWLLQVVIIPVSLMAIPLTMWAKRHKSDPVGAVRDLTSRSFFIAFFCYPSVCRYSFEMFRTYSAGPDARILLADDRFLFEDKIHQKYIYWSFAVIVVIALGVPLSILALLFYEYRNLPAVESTVEARVSHVFDLGNGKAKSAVRSIWMGGKYGFLTSAFKPECYWGESVDMLRKLMLIGVMVIPGVEGGSVTHIMILLYASVFFLAVQTRTCPYKLAWDNRLRLMSEAHICIMITVALAFKTNFDSEFASRFGRESQDAEQLYREEEKNTHHIYEWIVVSTFIVCVPGTLCLALYCKMGMVNGLFSTPTQTLEVLGDQDTKMKALYERFSLGLETPAGMHELVDYIEYLAIDNEHQHAGRRLWKEKEYGAHLTASEMASRLAVLKEELSVAHELGYHFTDLDSAYLILHSLGIRAASEGQLGGGVSVCLTPPSEMSWDKYGGSGFHRECGEQLWGAKWHQVMPTGTCPLDEVVRSVASAQTDSDDDDAERSLPGDGGSIDDDENELRLARGRMSARRGGVTLDDAGKAAMMADWGCCAKKLEVMLVLRIPAKENRRKAQIVPGRPSVYIIPPSDCVPGKDGDRGKYYSNTNLEKVFILKPPEGSGAGDVKLLIDSIVQGGADARLHMASERDKTFSGMTNVDLAVIPPESLAIDDHIGGKDSLLLEPWKWTVLRTTVSITAPVDHEMLLLARHLRKHEQQPDIRLWLEDVGRFTAAEMKAALYSISQEQSYTYALAFVYTTAARAIEMCQNGRGIDAEHLNVTTMSPVDIGWEQYAGGQFRNVAGRALWGSDWHNTHADELQAVLVLAVPVTLLQAQVSSKVTIPDEYLMENPDARRADHDTIMSSCAIVHIGGLSPELENETALESLFKQFGMIMAVTVRVRRYRDGDSMRHASWALISFRSAQGAHRAINGAADLCAFYDLDMVVRELDESQAARSKGMMHDVLQLHLRERDAKERRTLEDVTLVPRNHLLYPNVHVKKSYLLQPPVKPTGADVDADAGVEDVDTDGNGDVVSKEEALSFFRSKGYDVDSSWLDGAWDIMDKDQNGILDATEFLQMFDAVKTRASRACKVAGRVLESETERSSAAAEAVPPSHTENTRASLHVTNDADHIDIHYTCEVATFGASECLECSNQEVVLQMGSQESKAWKDKIVIFERGTMTFVAMALQAQESEAKAVVVINSDDESFVPGSGGEDTASVYVPIVCVSKSDGGKLKSMLGSTNRDKMRATLQFSITPESRAHIQAFAMFNTLDVDASNTLDREEFEKLIQALLPNMDATEREQAFEEVDKDNSGAVNRSEFLLWWEHTIKTHDEAQMELARRSTGGTGSCQAGERDECERHGGASQGY